MVGGVEAGSQNTATIFISTYLDRLFMVLLIYKTFKSTSLKQKERYYLLSQNMVLIKIVQHKKHLRL